MARLGREFLLACRKENWPNFTTVCYVVSGEYSWVHIYVSLKKETVLINYFRRKNGIDYHFNVKTTPAQLAVRRKEKT